MNFIYQCRLSLFRYALDLLLCNIILSGYIQFYAVVKVPDIIAC